MTDLPLKFKNELRQGGMKWPRVAIPVRLATPIRTGHRLCRTSNVTPTPLKLKNELCLGVMKWPRVAIPVRFATPIRTGAPVQTYLRHLYAFEVQKSYARVE